MISWMSLEAVKLGPVVSMPGAAGASARAATERRLRMGCAVIDIALARDADARTALTPCTGPDDAKAVE